MLRIPQSGSFVVLVRCGAVYLIQTFWYELSFSCDAMMVIVMMSSVAYLQDIYEGYI